MKKAVYILFSVSVLLLLAFGTAMVSNEKTAFALETKTKTFIAGNNIQIKFSSASETEKPQLFIVHSYGKTLLESTFEKGNYRFKIPENYIQKSGTVSWFLINGNEKVLNGTFEIIPNDKTETIIENYLGPRSILAGGKEFSMMVTVPTDGFDNPKTENTAVTIKHQFLQNIMLTDLKTKDFIAWFDIYSPIQSGKLLVSTECETTDTKEIETEIYPNIATNFTIYFTRNHEFADGNQITNFTTSIIKDEFGNTVSDGTMVSFIIKTKNNLVLKTFGTTINGIATAKILHPDHQDIYTVKGFITGIAESNSLVIDYKPIISTFNYRFSDQNRTLIVGPIKSFMNQLVPDGIKVVVKVYHNNKLMTTLQEDSSKGLAKFTLPKDFYAAKTYRFEISTLGITQKTKTLNYVSNK
jgi:prophage maintenance system killer protein